MIILILLFLIFAGIMAFLFPKIMRMVFALIGIFVLVCWILFLGMCIFHG